jgi:hypothetical protein
VERAFADGPNHTHIDPAKLIILQTDGNGFALAGILNQLDGYGMRRQVNFKS